MPAGSTSSEASPERDLSERIERRLEAGIHRVLPPVVGVLGVMFLFFASTVSMVLPPPDAAVMQVIGIGGGVILLAMWWGLGYLPLGIHAAHGALAVVTILCLVSAGTHFYLGSDPLLSNWFLLMVVALSQLAFSRRWFAALLALILVTWFCITNLVGWDEVTILYAIAMVSFGLSSGLMFVARRRVIYSLEESRIVGDDRLVELEAINDDLQSAREAAEQANVTKSLFLANMSHELRTPLNAIIGYAEMLTEDARDDGHEHYLADLEKVEGAGRHLLSLISDILDLSKIESGKLDIYLESLDIGPLIEDIGESVSPIITKNGNTLEVEVADDLPVIETDSTRLRQIALNLLSNAGKFTENGTVRFVVRRDEDAPQTHIVMRVEDSGIGMTAEQMERVFDAFRQADASTTRKYGGTGLGLAISKLLCERLGGTIDVESKMGEGSVFEVVLPVAQVRPLPATSMPPSERPRP